MRRVPEPAPFPVRLESSTRAPLRGTAAPTAVCPATKKRRDMYATDTMFPDHWHVLCSPLTAEQPRTLATEGRLRQRSYTVGCQSSSS